MVVVEAGVVVTEGEVTHEGIPVFTGDVVVVVVSGAGVVGVVSSGTSSLSNCGIFYSSVYLHSEQVLSFKPSSVSVAGLTTVHSPYVCAP